MKINSITFDGEIFAEKFNLDIDDFWVDGDELFCPKLPNLTEKDVEDCILDIWINVRLKRDRLLKESDWTMLPDSPLNESQKEMWKTYRQELRDITKTFDKPEDVIFPKIIKE